MLGYYKLEGHTPVALDDDQTLEWARWFETADRRVALDSVGPYEVSTVFLGLDHGFARCSATGTDAPPLIFETVVFDSKAGVRAEAQDFGMERYSTWEEAEKGHAEMVERVRAASSAS